MSSSKSDFLQQISECIASAHNPALVIKTESPNGNIIHHVYSDGEITSQKGGWAYLQRSEFTEVFPKFGKQFIDLFPIKTNNRYDGNFSYAIVTEENALKIVSMITKYQTMD